jgi:hypothetical protein
MILHPAVVKWAVEDRCAKLEATKRQQMADTKDASAKRSTARRYDRLIKEERERYATVKVVKARGAGWVLCYLGEKHGTGPFNTVDEAVAWFLGGGW